jgi:hypothetical protein
MTKHAGGGGTDGELRETVCDHHVSWMSHSYFSPTNQMSLHVTVLKTDFLYLGSQSLRGLAAWWHSFSSSPFYATAATNAAVPQSNTEQVSKTYDLPAYDLPGVRVSTEYCNGMFFLPKCRGETCL